MPAQVQQAPGKPRASVSASCPAFLLGFCTATAIALALAWSSVFWPSLRGAQSLASPHATVRERLATNASGEAGQAGEAGGLGLGPGPRGPVSDRKRQEAEEKPGEGGAAEAPAPAPAPAPRPNANANATGGLLWEEVPAVRGYLWRGEEHCGAYAWRGSFPSAVGGSWQDAVFLQNKGNAGVSNVMFWQAQFLVAWLMRRPLVLFSDGPLWTMFRSRHLPADMQVSNVTREEVVAKLMPTPQQLAAIKKGLRIPSLGRLEAKDECTAHFLDLASGAVVSVNVLRPPSTWRPPPRASLFLGIGSKKLQRLKHTVPLVCRDEMIQQLKSKRWGEGNRQRVLLIAKDFKLVGRCATRWAMGDLQPLLHRFLQPLLRQLAAEKAFLVGIHFRMGDTRMSNDLGRTSGASNDHRSQVPLQTYLTSVNRLLKVLAKVLEPLEARLVVFVASDNAAALKAAQQKLTAQVVANPGLSVHNTDQRASDAEIAKVYADWFCLALSGVLLSPSPGTNCNDGCGSGFSKTAGALGLPWLSALGRDINKKDIEKVRNLPIQQLLRQGIYGPRV